MKVDIYKKTKKDIQVKPNLDDYQKFRKSFSWKDAEKEIDFVNGKLNAAYNAVDRNAENFRKNKIALYWEGDNEEKKRFTFLDLSRLSSKFSNLLHSLEIDIGERVFFFLPRVPESWPVHR